MTTTKKRTGTASKTGAVTKALREQNEELTERYEHLQRRIGGLRYHLATNDGISTEEVLRLLDNVIDAS
tara:strand:- start:34 stop:240 length:207 start_codon:yes stop_codon:yes gene_type:complete